jgi:hypothetical protein
MGYVLTDIVGPILLLLALLYVVVRMWRRRPGERAVSEAGAKRLREQLNEEDQRRPDGSR